jgi:hypothetical protein
MTVNPSALTAAVIATLTPAELLAFDADDRYTIAEARTIISRDAEDRVAALRRELDAAERDLAIKAEAEKVAIAVADTADDKRHGRRPGDVLLSVEEPAREALVLGVSVNPSGDAFYLVVPYSSRDARPGDGALSEWVTADNFRRP